MCGLTVLFFPCRNFRLANVKASIKLGAYLRARRPRREFASIKVAIISNTTAASVANDDTCPIQCENSSESARETAGQAVKSGKDKQRSRSIDRRATKIFAANPAVMCARQRTREPSAFPRKLQNKGRAHGAQIHRGLFRSRAKTTTSRPREVEPATSHTRIDAFAYAGADAHYTHTHTRAHTCVNRICESQRDGFARTIFQPRRVTTRKFSGRKCSRRNVI